MKERLKSARAARRLERNFWRLRVVLCAGFLAFCMLPHHPSTAASEDVAWALFGGFVTLGLIGLAVIEVAAWLDKD
ncbi:hypothetical protein P2H44_07630 [Albimonas sp. CAU 1670]|uniref:hypothetical protein n=1 Tax=Albimonas sp. CAU 1670 TaxID=3032599 RepID=UPI0023DCE59A|nr:hypothetical protein [Albimonas sp. CAU 1670]MDF2232419.1 hypothetical protein [Albimonas sp. CAU 1670]